MNSGVHPICADGGLVVFCCMRGYPLYGIFAAAGVLRLMAGGALGAPPAANNSNSKIAVPTNLAVAHPMAAPVAQPLAPIGGAFGPVLTGGTQGVSRFGPSPTVLGGWFGSSPAGGTFQAGPIGGTMFGQNPLGGVRTGGFSGGANYPTYSPGGVLSGRPPGGQYGPQQSWRNRHSQ